MSGYLGGRVAVPPHGWAGLAAIGAVTLFGGLLRFTHLGRQSYWIDEVVTVHLLREHLWTMLRYGIPQSENTPPLYYVVGWLWVRLFGTNAEAVRSLSAVFGTATIPVAYYAGRRLVNGLVGLVAAALVACSPILVWYSQEARAYSLFVFLCALSFLFFARALVTHRVRDLAAWSICSTIALTAHYFAAFLIALEALFLIVRIRPRRPLLLALIPIVAVQILLLPLIEKQRNSGSADFIGNTKLTTRLEQLGGWFTAADYRSAGALAAAGLLITLGVVTLLFHRRSDRVQGGLVALGVGAGTIAIPLVLIGIGLDYFFFRNLLLAWVPLAVALATGFALTRLGLAAATALCVVFLIADVAVFRHPDLQRDNWRTAASLVTANPGPTAIAVYPAWDSEPLGYYARRLEPLSSKPVRVRSLWFVGISSRYSGWKSPAGLTLRIPRGFRLVSTDTFQHFILRRYSAPNLTAVSESRLKGFVVGANGTNIPHTQALLER